VTDPVSDNLEPLRPAPIDWRRELDLHAGWLRKVLAARLDSASSAEDVFQETVLAALEQKERPEDPTKVAAWIYRIAVRQVANHYRTHHRQTQLLSDYATRGSLESHDDRSPYDWVLRGDRDRAIADALSGLAPEDREVLVLKYTEDWTYQELARRLGVSEKTIEYRLLRARTALRERLRGFHADSTDP